MVSTVQLSSQRPGSSSGTDGSDHPGANLDVLRPGRYQTPARDQQVPLDTALVQTLRHDGNRLGRRHVPARRRRGTLNLLGLKVAQKVPRRLGHHVSAAHGAILPDCAGSVIVGADDEEFLAFFNERVQFGPRVLVINAFNAHAVEAAVRKANSADEYH